MAPLPRPAALTYDLVNGPRGKGFNDLFVPDINSTITPLPSVPWCAPLPDQAVAKDSDWTKSFQNIQGYDTLKVQAVSVGQKLNEAATKTQGGYLDAQCCASLAMCSGTWSRSPSKAMSL